MAKLSLTIPVADELSIIRYLLDEIEQEKQYNEEYAKECEKAHAQAEKDDKDCWSWYRYMDRNAFPREPRQSVIKDNIKTIRRLALKIGGR